MVAQRVFAQVAGRQVKYVSPISPSDSTGALLAVYSQIEREMRVIVPPMLLHSPAPDTLAAYWMLMRETVMASGEVARSAKEAVAAAVSVANLCPYCVDMHSMSMYDLASEADAEAVATDKIGEVADPDTRAIAAWARQAHMPGAPILRAPPFIAAQAAELIGVVVTFHYLNRMVNIFLSDYLLPPRLRGGARRRVKQGISRALRPMLRQESIPGESLSLLPEPAAPADVRWSSGNPVLTATAVRTAAAFEAAGERWLSDPVRALVLDRLSAWGGEDMGLDREWCEEAIEVLPARDRAAGRLAMLTAFASYRVDHHVVDAYRATEPSDAALVEATAWASYATAHVIGDRLASTRRLAA